LLVRHFSVATVDIGILGDSIHGVSVVAAPSILTSQGRKTAKLTWVRFDPERLIHWLNTADAYLRAPVQTNEAEGIRWAPRLANVGGTGWLTVGRRIRKQRLDRRRYAVIANPEYGWQFELSEAELQAFLNLMLEGAAVSRLKPIELVGNDGLALACDKIDRPVEIQYQPSPVALPGAQGRVVTQFVVDATGRPEMDTFVAVFASPPFLEPVARQVIAESRFTPGILHHRPVRVLVQQMISWR
jgi:Gram-negative bacterial TonB protein C-terminal